MSCAKTNKTKTGLVESQVFCFIFMVKCASITGTIRGSQAANQEILALPITRGDTSKNSQALECSVLEYRASSQTDHVGSRHKGHVKVTTTKVTTTAKISILHSSAKNKKASGPVLTQCQRN